jgi:peptidoglycan/xylan/chitin deacetylase (PgdA/CDA1 family)
MLGQAPDPNPTAATKEAVMWFRESHRLILLCAAALWPLAASAATSAPAPGAATLPPDVDQSWIRQTPKGAPRLIALTFDDGPAPGSGEKILDALKKQQWSATFCVIGKNAERHPELIRRMIAEGHEVASHSWSHQNLTQLDADGVSHEVGDSLHLLRTMFNIDTHWFRAPYSAMAPAIRDRIHTEFGCALLGLTVDSEDWKRGPDGTVTKHLLVDDLPDGSVILCHEWSDQTAAELPPAMAELAKRNYRSVTITTLLQSRTRP